MTTATPHGGALEEAPGCSRPRSLARRPERGRGCPDELQARRRNEDGRDAAQEVAEVPGQAPLGNYLLALALQERGRGGEAASRWRRSLQAQGGEQPLPGGLLTSFAERNLLEALIEGGDLDGARELLATFEMRPRPARRVRTEVWQARITARVPADE